MEPVSAADGAQALELLRVQPRAGRGFDVAILDMMMPGMDGLELARRIREEPDFADMKLVMLTSAGPQGDVAEARRIGVEAYLSKPTRQSELYDCLAIAMGRKEAVQPSLTHGNACEGRNRGGLRILLAEDNPVNQEVAVELLESLGCKNVTKACNGQEVLDRLARKSFDLILMDCQMPVLNGFAATTEIRRQEQEGRLSQRTFIVALTANAMADDRERCLAAGMDDYLPKPLRRNDLVSALDRVRGLASGGRRTTAVLAASTPDSDAPQHPAPQPPGDAPIDLRVIDSLRELERQASSDLVQRVVRLYLDGTPELLEELRRSIESADPNAMRLAAHSLKSSSANVGALRLSALCTEAERLGRSGTMGDATHVHTEILDEFERVARALAAIASGTPA